MLLYFSIFLRADSEERKMNTTDYILNNLINNKLFMRKCFMFLGLFYIGNNKKRE